MFSTGIAMLLFAVYRGRVEIVPVHYPFLMRSVRAAFLAFVFMCVAGLMLPLRGEVCAPTTVSQAVFDVNGLLG